MMSDLISLVNLRFSYDGDHRSVINDLSLDIPAGTITAILGPNGAGKTTLLHIMLGLVVAACGSRPDRRARAYIVHPPRPQPVDRAGAASRAHSRLISRCWNTC